LRGNVLLLREGRVHSAKVVNRSAYETAIHLVYLVTIGNKYENAILYETRVLLEVVTSMPPAHIVETSRELDALPADIRERVKRDKKKGRGLQWSGKTLGEMAAAIRIRGHKGFYAMQSRSVHALSAREDVLRVEGPEGVTFWRNDLDLAQVETIAMHTRRTILRPAYYLAFRDLYKDAPPLQTPDPPTPHLPQP
jgi:hypothetical protein